MRKLTIVLLSGLTLFLMVSLRFDTNQVTVISTEGFDTASAFESREGCITTLVQVALSDHEKRTRPAGDTTVRQSGVITLTQFSDPENGQDPKTGEPCPALLLQELSTTLEPSEEIKLEIDTALEKARFAGQIMARDQAGADQMLLFDVLWQAVSPLKTGHRVDTRQEGKTSVRTVYKVKSRKAVAYGFMAYCDSNGDGVCSVEEEQEAVNYLSIPSQGENTFIRWQKIRTAMQVKE